MVPGGAVKLIAVKVVAEEGKLTGRAKSAVNREVGLPEESAFHSERSTACPDACLYCSSTVRMT